MDKDRIAEWVRQARAGDREAAAALIREFQDVVTAVCVGYTGDLDLAQDAAQDTFVTVLGTLGSLREPKAFVAWLLQVARTCCRRTRQTRTTDRADLADPGVTEEHELAEEAALVHAGLASLGDADRMVLALAYLGGYSQAQIADFLAVPVSTVKKRAFDARRRLKGILPMVQAGLGASRPSRSAAFGDVILLYAAIRRGDAETVARLIANDPALVDAEEAWDLEEGRAAGLVFPNRGTPLVRASELGQLEVVEALLGAGAAIDGPCGCETAESPLWAATANGKGEVVSRLLAAGADPNRTAGPRVSPLHVALARQRPDIAEVLLRAGADPERVDGSGRTPRDWVALAVPGLPDPEEEIVPTGIKALDLLAPLPRGGLVYWHGSYGLGQQVLIGEIATALAPRRVTWLGYECDLLDQSEVAHLQAEAGLADSAFTVNLIPPGLPVEDRAALLDASVRNLERRAGLETELAVIVDHPDHTAALEAYLPRLRSMTGLVVTIFVGPRFSDRAPRRQPPAGFDAQVVLDPERGRRRLWPAVDAQLSRAARYGSARHQELAEGARQAMAAGGLLAEQLHAYLTQPLRVGQPFLGSPAQAVTLSDLLADIDALLSTPLSNPPVEELLYRGSLVRR